MWTSWWSDRQGIHTILISPPSINDAAKICGTLSIDQIYPITYLSEKEHGELCLHVSKLPERVRLSRHLTFIKTQILFHLGNQMFPGIAVCNSTSCSLLGGVRHQWDSITGWSYFESLSRLIPGWLGLLVTDSSSRQWIPQLNHSPAHLCGQRRHDWTAQFITCGHLRELYIRRVCSF